MSEAFPSSWLKAADLKGRNVLVTIQKTEMEDIGDGEKPVIFFHGKEKSLVLNKTNASMIVDSYGDDTDHWIGKTIEIYGDKTSFKGQIVPCIRVRVPAKLEPEPADPSRAEEPPPLDDPDVPF